MFTPKHCRFSASSRVFIRLLTIVLKSLSANVADKFSFNSFLLFWKIVLCRWMSFSYKNNDINMAFSQWCKIFTSPINADQDKLQFARLFEDLRSALRQCKYYSKRFSFRYGLNSNINVLPCFLWNFISTTAGKLPWN